MAAGTQLARVDENMNRSVIVAGSSLWATVSFNPDPRVMQLDPTLYAPIR
jgi:hypothetical protein